MKQYCQCCGKLIYDGETWLDNATLIGGAGLGFDYVCNGCFEKEDSHE